MKPPLLHFIFVSVTSILMLVGYGFWYGMVVTKSTDSATLQQKIDTNTESVSRIASARAALSEIAGDEAAVQGYFVSEDDVVSFIDDLEKRGQGFNTTVDVLSVAVSPSAKQPKLVLSLSVKGSFDGVMRTVGTIEYAPYDLSINSFSIGHDAKDSWHADLQISVGSVPLASGATTTPVVKQSAPTTSSVKAPTAPPVSAPSPVPTPTGVKKGTAKPIPTS